MRRPFDDRLVRTATGTFAVRDWGGHGRDLLLVHGTGHNVEAWGPVADRLPDRFHVVAFDLRGHGQTPVDSTEATQYWRDLGPLCDALGLRDPLLAGHSTGGYAVTAFAASGGPCAGIVVLDGFVPDDRATALQGFRDTDWTALQARLQALFRYGARVDDAGLGAYVREVCDRAPGDWLDDGVDAEVLARLTRRAFRRDGDGWLRRPTLDEIDAVRRPAPAEVFPSVEVYDRVQAPMTLVWATRGLYADRADVLRAIASRRSDRTLVAVDAGHNLPLQRPDAVAAILAGR